MMQIYEKISENNEIMKQKKSFIMWFIFIKDMNF